MDSDKVVASGNCGYDLAMIRNEVEKMKEELLMKWFFGFLKRTGVP